MTTYGSVCSGIEAATLAWEPLGWKASWFAEIEKFPSKVLAHRWPGVTNFGDMTRLPDYLRNGWITAPDVLVGGTPCQAFSVAGLRKGLVDPRGALTIKFVEIANAIDEQRPDDPCVVVWENVPGVLSDKSNAFGCFLAALVGEELPLEPPGGKWANAGRVLGPQRSAAWRILDAQYFGVAQRRRRVFVVASAREGFDPSAVLFESEGVRRDTAPSREKGQEVAGTLASRTGAGGFPGSDESMSGCVIPCHTTGAGFWQEGFGTLRSREQDSHENLVCQTTGTYRMTAFGEYAEDGTASTLKMRDYKDATDLAVCHAIGLDEEQNATVDFFGTLKARVEGGGFEGTVMQPNLTVRRLTPRECERLQGMPDDHTAIPGAADGPRYKSIGNSKAVPVVRWIGRRITRQLIMEDLLK